MKPFTDGEGLLLARWAFGYSGETTMDDMPEDLQQKIYEALLPDMPYGVAKGRTGTFHEWTEDCIDCVQYRFRHLEDLNDDVEESRHGR